jgi:hypothetical protein|tara:strand:- start:101 stop:376 length:276 start_codon:yes stop_codon:yes gene_type:complete
MDCLYLFRPEGLSLKQPGNQVAQVAAASFEISRQLFKGLLTSKFKRTPKSVCPYFLTWTPAKAIFFPARQVAPWSRSERPTWLPQKPAAIL